MPTSPYDFRDDTETPDADRRLLVERLVNHEKAIDWIERNVPGGIEIAAAALAQVPPAECPALQAILADAEVAWNVKGRYVKYFEEDGSGSFVFHLRSQWEKLRQLLGAVGYRQMIETGRAALTLNGETVEVHCFRDDVPASVQPREGTDAP